MPTFHKLSLEVITKSVATSAHAMAREDWSQQGERILSRISGKQYSEFFGAYLEAGFADAITEEHGYKTRQTSSAREPDLVFVNGHTMEVKTTSTDTGWTSGRFSKRPGDYILVSFDKQGNKVFVALACLTEKDWRVPTSDSYYGTSLTAADLERLIKEGRGKVILGGFRYGPRARKPYLLREAV